MFDTITVVTVSRAKMLFTYFFAVDQIATPSSVRKVPATEIQLDLVSTALRDSQTGYQTDLEVTKQAYDSRIEVRRFAFS